MEEEVWKDVEGYEEYYKVSSRGRVMRKKFTLRMKNGRKRLYREQECKQMVTKSCVVVSILGKTLSVAKVHRLVAMFYLDDYSEDLQVNHKNGIKTDNRVENLEMVTNQQNVLHAFRVLDSSERRRKISEANKRRKYNKKNI